MEVSGGLDSVVTKQSKVSWSGICTTTSAIDGYQRRRYLWVSQYGIMARMDVIF